MQALSEYATSQAQNALTPSLECSQASNSQAVSSLSQVAYLHGRRADEVSHSAQTLQEIKKVLCSCYD